MRGAHVRAITATVLEVDGIGACDHVSRAAMLQRLVNMEERAILPFVRLSYGSPSSYQWFNEDGECRTVTQVEGGEQGDPLIGTQGAVEEVSTQLLAGEQLCVFLDDVYVVCQPGRVCFIYNILADALGRVDGIQLHEGKTRVWNRFQTQPDNINDLGPEVWQPRGITVLGTPIGCVEYVGEKMTRRIETERQLWDTIPCVLDLQCAWQLLAGGNPRVNHSLRTLSRIVGSGRDFAGHSRQSSRCTWEDWDCAPHRDAPKLLIGRHGNLVEDVMALEVPAGGCLAELRVVTVRLDREGFTERPTWPELRHGKRPPVNTSCEPGEWQHSWQFWASSVSNAFFGKTAILSCRTAARRAHLRSHSGCNAGVALAHAPTTPECTVAPLLFRVLLLERLHLPLPVTEAVCSCGATLDPHGKHRAACSLNDRLKKRATPIELWWRAFSERQGRGFTHSFRT